MLKSLWWTVKVAFIVFCFYVGSLFFRQAKVPDMVVDEICSSLAADDMVVNVGGIDFGILHGIRFSRVRVFNRASKRALEPIFAAEEIEIMPLRRELRLVGVSAPRLHDGYYEPGTTTEPVGENGGRFSFPALGNWDLELVRPNILGVAPERVTANARVSKMKLDFAGIHLVWPDADVPMCLDGYCTIDLDAMRVHGKVDGLAKQAHIRPMLGDYARAVTLDVPVALPYMDAFTEVRKPVPAYCTWDVNLVNNAFVIKIGLKPELGRYNGVPLKDADGLITVGVWWNHGAMEFETSVDIASARDHGGRSMCGHIAVLETNTVRTVHLTASSDLRKDDALDIMGYLNGGLLDCFTCVTSPKIEAAGVLAPNLIDRHLNDMHGSVGCEDAKFFGTTVSNVTMRFDYVRDTMAFRDVSARGRCGGAITGDAAIRIDDFGSTNRDPLAFYEVDMSYRGGSVEELSDVFKFDLGKRHGSVDMDVRLSGRLYTNVTESLCGSGRVTVHNGHIAQMRLFSGLTELLAEKVPGVGAVVNLSDVSGDFTITNGVMRSDNIRIEGSLFSISSAGTYDIVRDELDFTVCVRLMKDDSTPVLKELVRLVSWPFSKLTLEFAVSGGLNDPKWKYISILDRVL